MMTTLADLETGTLFTFPVSSKVYEARGSGWYGTPKGNDGGPWRTSDDTEVVAHFTYNLAHACLEKAGFSPVPGSSRWELRESGLTGRIVKSFGLSETRWYKRDFYRCEVEKHLYS